MIYQNRQSDFESLVLPDTTTRDIVPKLVFISRPNFPDHLSRYNTLDVICHTLYKNQKKKIVQLVITIPEIKFEASYDAVNDSASTYFEISPGINDVTLCVYAVDEIGNDATFCAEYHNLQIPHVIKPEIICDDEIEYDFITFRSTPYSVFVYHEYDKHYAVDPHVSSQWVIRDAETNEIVYDTGESVDLTRHNIHYVPDSLIPNKRYTATVRHCGQVMSWSEWSDPREFYLLPENNSWYPYSQSFAISTEAQTFVVPEDTDTVRVLVIGGGALRSGRLGGKGGGVISSMVKVVPGEEIDVSVGNFSKPSTFGSYVLSGGGTATAKGNTEFEEDTVGRIILEINPTKRYKYPAGTYCLTEKQLSLADFTNEGDVIIYGISGNAGTSGTKGDNGAYGDSWLSSGKGGTGRPGKSGTSGGNGTPGGDGYYCGGNGGSGGRGGAGGSGGSGGRGVTGGNGGSGGNGGGGGNGANGGNGLTFCADGGAGGAGGSGGAAGAGGAAGVDEHWRPSGSAGSSGAAGDGGRGANGGNGGIGGDGGDGGLGGSGRTRGADGIGGNSTVGLVVVYYYSEKQHQQELAELNK